ncbi:hypothetical protein [Alicyclobacillus dauci]|uniref:Glutamine amidotransferase type-2 domain-containing protein n=1 Tax=Alicyclobacillus dauci TaxID=1475485 RepID=A0ABY6Z2K0_9BACL|nr:hypothetical protein [Alicyclobacillus dauci]WAH36970.1 hypothetical protein NZD86_22895 [Alicyclobacillus dauci]
MNAEVERHVLHDQGSIFQTSTDTEVIAHLLARSARGSFDEASQDVLRRIQGAFALLIMTEKKMRVALDRHGLRPLAVGKLGDAFVAASETVEQYELLHYCKHHLTWNTSCGLLIPFLRIPLSTSKPRTAVPAPVGCPATYSLPSPSSVLACHGCVSSKGVHDGVHQESGESCEQIVIFCGI